MSREVVIVEAARTAIGRGHPEKGYYKDVHPADLLGHTYRAVIERSGIDPAEVEYVIAGCVQQFGEQSMDIARNAWLQEGYPIEASASTIDLQCGSGQQAVGVATALIASGVHDVVIGSGVEHMGRNSFAGRREDQRGVRLAVHPGLQGPLQRPRPGHRRRADRRAVGDPALRARPARGRLAPQGRAGHRATAGSRARSRRSTASRADQGIRPDTSLEALSQLKPAFKPDGRITAGNSSQISDGAAAVLLMAREKADALGLTPRARIVDHTRSAATR